jgi:periplasmic protein TonB
MGGRGGEAPACPNCKMLATKELKADPSPASGRRLADSPRPMSVLKLLLARLNGWALSLLLHGGVAALAALSVFHAQMGGSGRSGDGGSGPMGVRDAYPATVRSDEPVISGIVLPDVAQYPHLTSEDQPVEPLADQLPMPPVPFDVFAVGSSEPQPTIPEPVPNPPSDLPVPSEARTVKLPPDLGNGGDGGLTGDGGSGGGNGGGNGSGEGSQDGNATGVYTPPPRYPSDARRRNLEGSVRVELAIAADGSCALRRIVESSGYGSFDTAVEEAVKTWKYRPADEDGRPELITKVVRFTFKLGR